MASKSSSGEKEPRSAFASDSTRRDERGEFFAMSEPALPPVIKNEQQKLVTVYLDNSAYAKGKALVGSYGDKHGLIEEHLVEYLSSGWRISKLEATGGGSDSLAVRGWIIALLER